jgi:alpha-tubulin suppressor-like RCC1 family protein
MRGKIGFYFLMLSIMVAGLNVFTIKPVSADVNSKWIQVAAGTTHNLGIKKDGTVWAWGDNRSAQLGDGSITFIDDKTYEVTINANKSLPVRFIGESIGAKVGWGKDTKTVKLTTD